MDAFRIVKINYNIEIISKIINSIAKKYDCKVKFDHETETVASNCEEQNKSNILAEVMGIFGVN
ncbi:MAG: hypothetical protein KJP23_04505 [Deltaproteobacteria bacterium]|nr:hypothetical protein [Deltaproteobacteria bacterium]